ncbi:hypothetical protein ACJMK2_026196 [Sinanodonta woodiana]|uniref:Ig-like domain-containing protein n=1 Tax=Sinanodonta woodiana TaxID=1069815 RepID=A0ABD3XIV8_SINWO
MNVRNGCAEDQVFLCLEENTLPLTSVNLESVTDKMDFKYFAVLMLVAFDANESAKCDNEDIIAMTGCNISLTWSLRSTEMDFIAFNIGISYERPVASLLNDLYCRVWDNSSMFCYMSLSKHWLIIVLNIFNVTARESGNYTLWKRTLLEKSSYTSKKLFIIGKPTIMEVRKPVLGLPFQMTCSITYEQKYFLYRWRIHDIESTTAYNVDTYTISSLGMHDNFSNVTCQVCLNQNTSNHSCVNCQNDGCSIYSDPYKIQVIYGPDNVSLSRAERQFYLKEHDIFAIYCFANCYPKCIFWWKGRYTIESQTLNIVFEPKMSGHYACYVTNQQTNITIISEPISLHYVKEDFQRENSWVGTVTVCVFLLIIGILIVVTIWRRTSTTRTMGFGKLSQVCVQTQTEVSQTEQEWQIKMRECERTRRLACSKHSQEENIRSKLHEDNYSTIDDDTLSDDKLRMNLIMHNNSHKTRNNAHIHYDYAHSIGKRQMETHVVDETPLTPISGFAHPVEIVQDEGNEVPDTNHSYLTVIDDSSHSMDVHPNVKKFRSFESGRFISLNDIQPHLIQTYVVVGRGYQPFPSCDHPCPHRA